MEIMTAARQWAERPADERFASLAEMYAAAVADFESATEVESVNVRSMRVAVDPTDDSELILAMDGPEGNRIGGRFSNWSFGQFCSRAKAPGGFLRDLRPATAARVINERVEDTIDPELEAFVLRANGTATPRIRALTSEKYERIWDKELIQMLMDLGDEWVTPPARPAMPGQPGTRIATNDDVVLGGDYGIPVRVGDEIAPAGLYRSDRDMFAFLVNPKRPIYEPGNERPLFRGFFLQNSEVGSSALHFTEFLFRGVCGNHIIWDASGVSRFSFRHVGDIRGRMRAGFVAELREYADSSSRDDTARIQRLMQVELGKNKAEVIEAVLKMLPRLISKRLATAAYERTEILDGADGNPRTAWGMAQGLTRISQESGGSSFTNKRADIDRIAGRLLAVASN